MLVLRYIHSTDRRFHTFVANRVAAIQSEITPSQWRYVNTSDNPANDTSRGLAAGELVGSQRWIRGPEFRWSKEEDWPIQPAQDDVQKEDPEVKTKMANFAATAVAKHKTMGLDRLLSKCSSWHHLKRAVAWILRFKSFLLQKIRQPNEEIQSGLGLSVHELRQA
ncbi:uncharacterized protein LOC135500852 [Lineus longissimus]|uniref:uncharacterized protein LOC135500841 n=1 Tax=Lineus longissimus TaxID=88925 RepID=UPI00315C5BBE